MAQRLKGDELAAELRRIYYHPELGFSGAAALQTRLREENKNATLKDIRAWLKTQRLHQVHAAAQPKPNKPVTRFTVTKPNQLHQSDLLYLTNDRGYKYALTLVDAASRYKAAVPLKSKSSKAVADAITEIYQDQKSPLKPPKQFRVDQGKEFFGETGKLLRVYKTKIERSEPKHHKGQAFVESFHRRLAERLYKGQEAAEKDGKATQAWVKRLPGVVAAMNREKTRLIGMSPNEAVKLEYVKQPAMVKTDGKMPEVPFGALVRLKLEPDDNEGRLRRRATDAKFSSLVYPVERVVLNPNGNNLYYVRGKKHGYRRDQLLVVSSAGEEPPERLAQPRPEEHKRQSAVPQDAPVWVNSRQRAIRLPKRLRD